MNKPAAHDRWVCFACRWSAKHPLGAVGTSEQPRYCCPTCRAPMIWSGPAFRPPPRDDDEAWQVAEQLIASGFRFLATRRRAAVPRTLAALAEWNRDDDAWLAERPISVGRTRGLAAVRSGRRALADGEAVLIWTDGSWRAGVVKLRGDGGKALAAPLVIVAAAAVESADRAVALTARTRVRLARRISGGGG